jgi:L-fuconolactonase
VDLASPRVEEQLLEFKAHPKFVGARHVVEDEPDDDFLGRPEILRGSAVLEEHGVPYDALAYAGQFKALATVARRLPGLTLVLDPLGKPRIRAKAFGEWKGPFLEAARCPDGV